jgi:peptide methionine sulfoxide reductase MsrA
MSEPEEKIREQLPPIDLSAPHLTESATFALGRFWGPDSRFGVVEGVVRTPVGYAGGTTANPTYHNIFDHNESIGIDFDS